MSDDNALLFGRRIQRLKYYMAVAATPIGADPVMSDMKEFGFTVPGELLNLVSAVSATPLMVQNFQVLDPR